MRFLTTTSAGAAASGEGQQTVSFHAMVREEVVREGDESSRSD